jgi:Bacteriophage lambda head decoration protein D
MTTLTEGARNAEHLGFDVPDFSREQVTFASGQNIVAGRVLAGPITAMTAAAVADVATGVAFGSVDATIAAKKGVASVRSPTVLNGNLVTFATGITTPQKNTQIAALLALGIVLRF